MAANKPENFELTPEERDRVQEFLRDLGFKTIVSTVFHPIAFAKVLFQLGHEPYPLTLGKSWVYFGRDAHYLPNVLSYLRNVYRERGLKPIYRGIEANILSNVAGATTSLGVSMYLDRFYPQIGGAPTEEKEEWQMSNHESFRVKVRQVIRNSIAHTIATIVSRPFTVIMVREIAQYVGGENKYPNFWTSVWRIGNEEGIAGYFSGLIPDLIAGYITILGVTGVRYVAERFLENTFEKEDEAAVKTAKDVRFVLQYAIPLVVSSFSYPFKVISTVMAVSGSNLAVSLLPYSPTFANWNDAYSYMEPNGFSRGKSLFMRKQTGPFSVGGDGNLYASNKHFI